MSDDSHGIDHIGTNYARLLAFIQTVGTDRMHYIERAEQGKGTTTTTTTSTRVASIALTDLVQLPFWEKAT